MYDVKGSINPQEENKAGWREEQRQRRWNCLNQSSILLLPMCCTVIEVKVTGSAIPPPPSDTDSDTLTTHPALLAVERCRLCSGFKGGGPVRVRKQEECRPSFTDGDAISAGAVGGYQGDSSTSTLSRWMLRHCHLLAKTWMCHTKLGVLPRD